MQVLPCEVASMIGSTWGPELRTERGSLPGEVISWSQPEEGCV